MQNKNTEYDLLYKLNSRKNKINSHYGKRNSKIPATLKIGYIGFPLNHPFIFITNDPIDKQLTSKKT